MLDKAKRRGFSPQYVIFDSWYSGLENLKAVRAHGWCFFTRLKSNRLVNPDDSYRRSSTAVLRFKDLRRTWAVSADRAGLTLSALQQGMGHRRQATAIGYTRHQVGLDIEAARRVAREMGLAGEDIEALSPSRRSRHQGTLKTAG